MAVICGFDEVMFACMSLLGSPGFVASPPANFAPLLYYELWVAAQRDDYTRMKAVLRALQPLTDFVGRMNAAHGPHTGAHALPYGGGNMLFSVTKEGMNLSGLCGGRVRLPLVDVNATEVQELKPIVAELEAFKGVG